VGERLAASGLEVKQVCGGWFHIAFGPPSSPGRLYRVWRHILALRMKPQASTRNSIYQIEPCTSRQVPQLSGNDNRGSPNAPPADD
jgi:hypothetical protein